MSKDCYCHTCGKAFHHLGIPRHRAMHRDKRENCKITFSHGDTYEFLFEDRDKPRNVIVPLGNENNE